MWHIIKALKLRRSHPVQFDFGGVTEAYSKHGTNKFHISMILELQSVELNQLQMKGHSKTAKHLNCISHFATMSQIALHKLIFGMFLFNVYGF